MDTVFETGLEEKKMNKFATIGAVLAVLVIAGAVLAYAQVQKKDTAAANGDGTATAGCPCGCDGNCGGNCGNPVCTCAKAGATAGNTPIASTGSCAAKADAGCGCGGKTGASCGGSCGMASCGCGA